MSESMRILLDTVFYAGLATTATGFFSNAEAYMSTRRMLKKGIAPKIIEKEYGKMSRFGKLGNELGMKAALWVYK